MTIKSIFILGLLNVCFGITVQATPVNFVAIPDSHDRIHARLPNWNFGYLRDE